MKTITLNEILKNVHEGQSINWSYLEEVKSLKLYGSGNAFTNEGTSYETYTTGKLDEEEEMEAPREEKNRILITVAYPTALKSGCIFIDRIS
ncbi:hypothetical protein AALM74_04785 [Parabacteroides segnis]|uniref:hypothetical protein n=1 Tax=Parabacteroides segnis TaxID=2763058 RepID=UPI00351280BB